MAEKKIRNSIAVIFCILNRSPKEVNELFKRVNIFATNHP